MPRRRPLSPGPHTPLALVPVPADIGDMDDAALDAFADDLFDAIAAAVHRTDRVIPPLLPSAGPEIKRDLTAADYAAQALEDTLGS